MNTKQHAGCVTPLKCMLSRPPSAIQWHYVIPLSRYSKSVDRLSIPKPGYTAGNVFSCFANIMQNATGNIDDKDTWLYQRQFTHEAYLVTLIEKSFCTCSLRAGSGECFWVAVLLTAACQQKNCQ